MKVKYIPLLLILLVQPAVAIGSLQVGIFGGFYPDINNLSGGVSGDGGDRADGTVVRGGGRRDAIQFFDNLIQQAVAANQADKGSTIGDPLGALWGIDLRYHWNVLFFRMAMDYATQVTATSGSLEAGGFNDKIAYSSWAASIPITIGLSHALSEFFHFYMGFGPYYGISHLKVTHSAPDAFANIGPTSLATTDLPYKSMSMTGDMLGVHLLIGLQVPLYEKKLFLSIDYMTFQARSDGVRLRGTNADGTPIPANRIDVITQKGSKILLGLQYLIKM